MGSRKRECFLVVVGVLVFAFVTLSTVQGQISYRDFFKKVQMAFAKEAGSEKLFVSAVQSARLLGLLEGMDEKRFPSFLSCLAKEKGEWGEIAAKRRQRLIDDCKGLARAEELVKKEEERKPAARPAEGGINLLSLIPIQDDLQRLSTKLDRLESILTSVKSEQDTLASQLQNINRSIASMPRTIPVPVQPALPPQAPPTGRGEEEE